MCAALRPRGAALLTPPPAPSAAAQVRCRQLDKEAGELRLENDTLLRTVEEAKHAAARGEEVRGGGAPRQRSRAQRSRGYRVRPVLSPARTPPLLPSAARSTPRWRRAWGRCRAS